MKNIFLKASFLIIVLAFIANVQTVKAQFGLHTSYQSISFETDSTSIFNDLNTGFSIGLDYWFRLKNKRLEFTPEISFTRYNRAGEDMTNDRKDFQSFQFRFNTNIYPFSFNDDCDCPTFSKDNVLIKKGFFVSFHPTISKGSYYGEGLEGLVPNDKINYHLGLGAGIDIGISDLFTLTPFFRHHRKINQPNDAVQYNWNQNQFGLRLGFRPDY